MIGQTVVSVCCAMRCCSCSAYIEGSVGLLQEYFAAMYLGPISKWWCESRVRMTLERSMYKELVAAATLQICELLLVCDSALLLHPPPRVFVPWLLHQTVLFALSGDAAA